MSDVELKWFGWKDISYRLEFYELLDLSYTNSSIQQTKGNEIF